MIRASWCLLLTPQVLCSLSSPGMLSCSADSEYHGTMNQHMVHHPAHSNILLLCKPQCIPVGVVDVPPRCCQLRGQWNMTCVRIHVSVLLTSLVALTPSSASSTTTITMLALCSPCTSTSIATTSTCDAYAVGLLMWPSACMLYVLLLSLCSRSHPAQNTCSGVCC